MGDRYEAKRKNIFLQLSWNRTEYTSEPDVVFCCCSEWSLPMQLESTAVAARQLSWLVLVLALALASASGAGDVLGVLITMQLDLSCIVPLKSPTMSRVSPRLEIILCPTSLQYECHNVNGKHIMMILKTCRQLLDH